MDMKYRKFHERAGMCVWRGDVIKSKHGMWLAGLNVLLMHWFVFPYDDESSFQQVYVVTTLGPLIGPVATCDATSYYHHCALTLVVLFFLSDPTSAVPSHRRANWAPTCFQVYRQLLHRVSLHCTTWQWGGGSTNNSASLKAERKRWWENILNKNYCFFLLKWSEVSHTYCASASITLCETHTHTHLHSLLYWNLSSSHAHSCAALQMVMPL